MGILCSDSSSDGNEKNFPEHWGQCSPQDGLRSPVECGQGGVLCSNSSRVSSPDGQWGDFVCGFYHVASLCFHLNPKPDSSTFLVILRTNFCLLRLDFTEVDLEKRIREVILG